MEYVYKLNTDKKQWLSKRVEELVNFYHEYCDDGNYRHLCNIFTAIALYEMLQEYGLPEEEAFEMISSALEEGVEEEKERLEKLAKLSIFWPATKKVLSNEVRRQTGYGWKFNWNKEKGNDDLIFACTECIYQKIFMQHGLDKLGPLFCQAEFLAAEDLPNIAFDRTGSMCNSADKCEFCFAKKK